MCEAFKLASARRFAHLKVVDENNKSILWAHLDHKIADAIKRGDYITVEFRVDPKDGVVPHFIARSHEHSFFEMIDGFDFGWRKGIDNTDCASAGNIHEICKKQGHKDDGDKPRLDLIDSYATEELAKVLTFGAKKYPAHNWRKGIAVSRLIAAALLHLFALLRGEDTDPETGLSHASHAQCCCMFLVWTLKKRKDMDDRFKGA